MNWEDINFTRLVLDKGKITNTKKFMESFTKEEFEKILDAASKKVSVSPDRSNIKRIDRFWFTSGTNDVLVVRIHYFDENEIFMKVLMFPSFEEDSTESKIDTTKKSPEDISSYVQKFEDIFKTTAN